MRYALLLLAACGGLRASFTPEIYDRLSREDRLAIYERENSVIIAQSRFDEAYLTVADTKNRLNALDDRWDRCKTRLEKNNQGGRIDGARKIKDTQEAFLEDQLRIAKAHVQMRLREIDAARAKVEQQKQRQLVKSGLAGERSIDDFDRAVHDTEADVKEAEKRELDLRAESQKRFLEWKAAENEYARGSGDFDSMVWAD